jgi:hypothetical protein
MPTWRVFVWAGVVSSVLAWTWAWYVTRGPQAFMVFVALAAVAVAFRATQGNRPALVAEMVAGFVMFLASVYWVYLIGLTANGPVSMQDWLATTLVPMVAAIVLVVGATTGFRHARTVTTTS